VNKVSFETEICVGCRTCEIACSYHHKGVFMPSVSSIEIINRPEDPGFAVSFYTQAENGILPATDVRDWRNRSVLNIAMS
jgi:Fe-S-cluster-containing hydrogenase component 2